MLYLTPDTWHLISDTSTWHVITWLDIMTPDTCITWHIHDYHCYGDLDMIIILLLDIWYSWIPILLNSYIPCTHVPCTLLMLIAQSYRRPAEHAWCRDDEDVSNLWGTPLESVGLPPESTLRTKCHMEQSVTPHMWWATSWICGATSWICGTTSSLLPVPLSVSVIRIFSVY